MKRTNNANRTLPISAEVYSWPLTGQFSGKLAVLSTILFRTFQLV